MGLHLECVERSWRQDVDVDVGLDCVCRVLWRGLSGGKCESAAAAALRTPLPSFRPYHPPFSAVSVSVSVSVSESVSVSVSACLSVSLMCRCLCQSLCLCVSRHFKGRAQGNQALCHITAGGFQCRRDVRNLHKGARLARAPFDVIACSNIRQRIEKVTVAVVVYSKYACARV